MHIPRMMVRPMLSPRCSPCDQLCTPTSSPCIHARRLHAHCCQVTLPMHIVAEGEQSLDDRGWVAGHPEDQTIRALCYEPFYPAFPKISALVKIARLQKNRGSSENTGTSG